MNSVKPEDVKIIEKNLEELNPSVIKLFTNSVAMAEDLLKLKGKKVFGGRTMSLFDYSNKFLIILFRCLFR